MAKCKSDSANRCKSWMKEFSVSSKDCKLLPPSGRCVFCFSSEQCEERFGEFLRHEYTGLVMHYFCLLLSSGLHQTNSEDECSANQNDLICGFSIKKIICEVKRASKLSCSVCKKRGASIGCVVPSCKTKFHFPCGKEISVLTQYYGSFPSYCQHHRPTQNSNAMKPPRLLNKKVIDVHPHQCPVCLSSIKFQNDDFSVLKTPCCSGGLLHRSCVERQALSSGTHFFRCPICNDDDRFSTEMKRMGIYVPERDASWEMANGAYIELLQRHSYCDVTACLCPHGRDYNPKDSHWSIVLCDLCGSAGTHIHCTDTVDSPNSYYSCDVCTSIHGVDGARELAIEMGVITRDHVIPRRSARRRAHCSASSHSSNKKRRTGECGMHCDAKESII